MCSLWLCWLLYIQLFGAHNSKIISISDDESRCAYHFNFQALDVLMLHYAIMFIVTIIYFFFFKKILSEKV